MVTHEVSGDSVMKMEDVPVTGKASCESHEARRMAYLVWYLAPHPENKYPHYTAQLWAENVPEKSVNGGPTVLPVRKIKLMGVEQTMSLQALMSTYPHPPLEASAC